MDIYMPLVGILSDNVPVVEFTYPVFYSYATYHLPYAILVNVFVSVVVRVTSVERH